MTGQLIAGTTHLPVVGVLPVLSTVLAGLGLIGLHLVVRDEWDEPAARRATLYLAYSPVSFVYSMGYAEGLVLFCLGVGLWAIRRHHWWLGVPLGVYGAAGRANGFLVGLAFFFAAAVQWRRTGRFRLTSWLPAAATPLGTLAFMRFSLQRTGDPFRWTQLQKSYWGMYPTLQGPWLKLQLIGRLFTEPEHLTVGSFIGGAGFLLGGILLVVLLCRRPPLDWTVYTVAAFALVVCTSLPASGLRYVLTIPFLLVGLARVVPDRHTAAVVGTTAGLGAVVFFMTITAGVVP